MLVVPLRKGESSLPCGPGRNAVEKLPLGTQGHYMVLPSEHVGQRPIKDLALRH